MRKDISAIQTWELQADLEASKVDITVCESALAQGITEYSGGLVQERLDTNKRIVAVIEEELKLRQ